MRPGFEKYQATYMSNIGLTELDEAFSVFGMPFFLANDEEVRAVQKKLTPIVEQRLQAKGLHLLAWGTGGWVQLFSKKELRTLADVKNAKLFVSKGAPKWVNWYVKNGFHPVELVPASIPEQLKLSTGLIDTALYVPCLASNFQVFRDAKYMLDLHIAPLSGALIISNAAWNKISPEDKPRSRPPPRRSRSRSSRRAEGGRGLHQVDADARPDRHQARPEGRRPNSTPPPTRWCRRCAERWCRATCSTSPCRRATPCAKPKASR